MNKEDKIKLLETQIKRMEFRITGIRQRFFAYLVLIVGIIFINPRVFDNFLLFNNFSSFVIGILLLVLMVIVILSFLSMASEYGKLRKNYVHLEQLIKK